MELTTFLQSATGGWFLLGLGIVQAGAAFWAIFKNWSKDFHKIARYPKLARSFRFYPLELLIVSWVGLYIFAYLASAHGHVVVAITLISLGALQVLAALWKRFYRPLKLPDSENLLEGDAKR